MSLNTTPVKGNAGLPATVKEVKKPKKTEDLGFVWRTVANLTEQKQKATLDGVDVKPINGTWSGLLHDLARYLIVEGTEENIEPLIENVSGIIQQVLLSMGTIKANAIQPAKMDDDQFVKTLASNLLKIFLSHDLVSIQDEVKLKSELKKIFNELLECAGLDEKHIKDKPDAIRHLLYPSLWSFSGLKVYAGLEYVQRKYGVKLSRDSFEQIFVDKALSMLKAQKNLSAKSKDEILGKNEGASQLADKLAEKLLEKLRDGKLEFSYKFLNMKENKTFLNSLLNKVMAKQEQGPENDEIKQAWQTIDEQLRMAIKAILAVVLTPIKGHSAENYRNALLIQILDRLGDHKNVLNQKVVKISEKDKDQLSKDLSEIIGPQKGRAKELLSRRDISWEQETIAFISEAWRSNIKENPTHSQLLRVLNTWEKEAEHNPNWKAAYSDKVQSLISRDSLTWENEVKQFLKKIEYTDTARSILSHELKSEKFADFIPSIFKAEDLFELIYEFIGEATLEIHEQHKFLEQKGEEALKFINTSEIPDLPTFFDELMSGLVATVDDMAKKGEIDLGQGKFLNEMACHLLNEEELIPAQIEGASVDDSESADAEVNPFNAKKFAKQEVMGLAKNILMIALRNAIVSNTIEGKQAEAFSKLFENFFKNSTDGLAQISVNCREMKEKTIAEKTKAVQELSKNLGVDIKPESEDEKLFKQYRKLLKKSLSGDLLENPMSRKAYDSLLSANCKEMKKKTIAEKTKAVQELSEKLKLDIEPESEDEKLLKQYRKLLVKSLSRGLLENLMPRKLFDSLLPPMLRKFGLWEMVADEMVPFIKGISITLDSLEEASKADPKEGKQLKLIGDSKILLPLLEPLTAKAVEFVSDIKFSKLLKQNGDSKLSKVDFGILDKMFGLVLKKGGQITNLIKLALPPIVESVLAFHFNPKDGKTSQELAVELLWIVLVTAHACYKKIDAVKAENLDLEALKIAFEGSEEFKEGNLKENIDAYCKEKKIKAEAATILNDKQFYVWLKINREMSASIKVLMDKVLPQDLWNLYIPKQFEKLFTRETVGAYLLDFLKEGYNHASQMRKMVSEGKLKLKKEDGGKAEGEISGLQKIFEQKVIEGLQNAAKVDPADSESIRWVKDVLQLLLDKQTADGSKPLTKIATDGAYALFSKLLSGGLSSLNKAPTIAKMAGDDPSLIGKVSKLIVFIRRDYLQLNELSVEQKCLDLPQINPANVARYLSLGDNRLKADEAFNALTEKFEMKDGNIVFRVFIKNSKTNVVREVIVDTVQFVYWEAAFQTINEIVPDTDWKELVPELMRPLMTKEMIAEFAVPYIHAARQIQEPLQKKGQAGKKLADEVAGEDPKGNLNVFIKDKVIDKIHVALEGVANDPEKLNGDLPDALDRLFKDVLKTKENVHFVEIKNVLVERVVYLLLNELFKPAIKGADGVVTASATSQTVANIIPKLSTLIQTYGTSGKNAAVIAQKLMDEVLPQAVWDEIFTGKFKDLIAREMIVEQIEKKVKEVCSTIDIVNGKQVQAMKEIKRLDRDAGLLVGRGGGLEEMLKTICKSIDETIDEYGAKKENIVDGQPLLINELAKWAFRDPVISKVIKDSAHSLVTVCLARVFQAKPNQQPEERLLEVMAGLFNAYNAADPKATATAWLKEFLPEDLRKEILPPFLRETLDHAFLADMLLKDYVPEVKAVADMLKVVTDTVNAAPKEDEGKINISKLQRFVKSTLGKYKDRNFSRDGLAGFGGFVKSLEAIITGAIAGDQTGKEFEGMGKLLESFLDGSVAQILSGPQMKKLLHKQFLSEAMIFALPMFGEVDVAKDLPNYPKLQDIQLVDLSPEGLKKIGLELKRFAGEKDDAFKQRVINKHFELQCGKLAGGIAFPSGAADLPVPKVAQSAVFHQVEGAIGNQIGRIVNRNERILFAIDFFGVGEADKKKFQVMEDHLKATGSLGDQEKTAERMFKEGLVSFAMQKIEQNFPKWPRFFRWFAVGFVKMIAKIALKVAINRQVWNFVSDSKNDAKFRNFVWKLLSFAKSYDPQMKDEKQLKELSKGLKKTFGQGFKDMGILRGIRSKAASGVTGVLSGQNFVDLIT